MKEWIKKILANEKMRYLIAGGSTTVVNFVVFFLLRICTKIPRNTCNVIAIIAAIIFAYFANKFFVFRSRTKGFYKTVLEAVQFVAARLVSMVVEVLGFAILCDSFRMPELASKLFIQVVIIVLNYIFSKLIIFKEKKGWRENIRDNWCYYITFAIVAVFLLIVCIVEDIAPFGENALTLVDSAHQYLPFFSEFRDKLLHEGSLLYTWNVALGSNFVSLASYYLMSPFNFLFLLFGKEQIAAVTCFTMCLKIALSAVAMTHFLSYKDGKKRRNFVIVAISVAYGLSNYVIAYNWNTMWLDCIMIFPLIMLGFDRMLKEKDAKLYVLSLFYALYCNYYIGYIICLFLVLWFFVYRHETVKKFFADGLRFAIYSLISGGMAAFILLPAYFGIMSTAAGDMALPKGSWYGNIFVMLRQLLMLTKPITNQTFDGGVNLYCGMLSVLAMVLYLFVKERPLQKIKKYLLLIFLVVSFNHTTLNYIWHGMHDQYGIPNRFSFLFIFVLLVMTYDALRKIRRMDICYVISATLLSLAFVLICRQQQPDAVSLGIMISSMAIICTYGVVCALYSMHKLRSGVFAFIIGGMCVVEILVNAAYGFMDNGYSHYMAYYETSPAVTKAYNRVKEMAQEEDAGFYRAEVMKYTVLDEVSWHNMPSVSTFNSTVLGSVVTTMGRLGFYTGANEFLYRGYTPFTNALFNVRYLLERPGDLNNFDYDYKETVENVSIYENPYPTSIGFAVNNTVKDWDRDAYMAMTAQNTLAYDMTGVGGIFTIEDSVVGVSSDMAAVSYSQNTISYTPNAAGKLYLMASFTADHAGDYYVNCRGNYVTKIRVYVNGQEYAYDRYQLQTFHIGQLAQGDYVSIEYEYDNVSADPGTAQIYIGTFNHDAFDSVYRELTQNMLQLEKLEDGYVDGTIDMPEGETLFTSIPYDEGWKLKIDGKEAEYYEVAGAFIGVDMEPGTHTIEFVYVPRGLYLGIAISLASVICLMACMAVENTLKKRKKEQDADIDRSENV